MPVSSSSLFHFTNSSDNLFGILKNEFIPKFCLEKYWFGNEVGYLGIPMVCFCDIPLSQIKEHIDIYGDYGIGLSKRWAEANKLNPVFYIEPNSKLAHNSGIIIQTLYDENLDFKEKGENLYDATLELVESLKIYSDDFEKNGKIHKNYCFYNEREWRYLPKYKHLLSKEQFLNNVMRSEFNNKIKKLKLRFTPNDITYIIIKNENEIDSMIRSIRYIKGDKFPTAQIEKLISRILTVEQIRNDF